MSQMPLPQSPIKTFIDLKANGEASRMRNHRGNMPSLPQTKCCALCPAKFTRTTHLNRHLRSHTNERAHRCSNCNAEFTRSDLLTRHKRTCGDINANKSRRKSCQACVESKVKCNLEQPCSKCSAKGKECIFINDPGASRHKKGVANRRSPLSASPSEEEASECCLGLENLGSSSASSTISHISHDIDNVPHIISPYHPRPQFISKNGFGLTGISAVSDGSSVCSSRSSPQLDSADSRHISSNTFHTSFDTMELDSNIHNLFPNVPNPYMEDSSKFSSCMPWMQSEPDVSPWSEPNQTYGIGGSHVFSQPLQGVRHDQSFVSGLTNLTPSSFSKSAYSKQSFCSYPPVNLGAPISASSVSGNPTTEELNQYLYLFFTEFSTHIPLLHRPTWNSLEYTHPVLLKAMRACGALFTKTMTATNFIITTLTSSQDVMLLEISKPSCTLKDHICLMLAVVLLQSIGVLHPRPEQRSLLRMYHEILVTMIRKTGLIRMIRSWSPPNLSDQASLESAWNDWARYETLKRTLVLAYLQDCSYCIYYSIAPAFLGLESEINLPCDDALWRAQTSTEWYKIQQAPSPYGMGLSRMLGTNMQFTLASLKDRSTSAVHSAVNPFALFILIHSILRDIFSVHNTRTTHGSSPHTGTTDHDGINDMNTITIQSSLHNWQKIWSANPETDHSGENSHGLPFVCNAIPYYWLARLAEAAKQKGTMHIDPPTSTNDIEDRYRLVKTWLMQISSCLLSGSQVSPDL